MKLAHKYESETLALDENILWNQEVQSFFFKILTESPEIDNNRISYIKDNENSEFNYKLSDEEEDFYENKYVAIGDVLIPNESSIVYRYFDNKEFLLNIREKDIFDFVLDTPQKKLMIIGQVGWGKTTVIKYCLFYLTQKNKKLKKIIHPIFISLHKELSEITTKIDETNIKKLFYNSILLPLIKKYTSEIINITNDVFWEYISNFPTFSDYSRQYANYFKIYKDNNKELNKKINELRNKTQLINNDIYLYALNYSSRYQNNKPVIIIDDADKVPTLQSSLILEIIRGLSSKHNIKVIFAVRPSTYNTIFTKGKHLKRIINPALSVYNSPNLKPYLKSRKILLENYKKECQEILITINGVKYPKPKAIDFLISMTDLLLKEENINFVNSISNGDIRKLTSILKVYYSSYYINHNDLFLRGLKENIPISTLPNWLLHIPIITNNHSLYLSNDDESSDADKFVLNIFHSNNNNKVPVFIKLYILKFMSNEGVSTLKELTKVILELFTQKKQPYIKDVLLKLIPKLINYRLLNSEDIYSIDDEDDLKYVKGISIDSAGRFYLFNLIFNFEYLTYIKDDFNFSETEESLKIKDALQSIGIYQRYIDVLRFIREMFFEENIFLNKLNRKRLNEYKINFSPNEDSFFYSKEIAEKLLLFGNKNIKSNLNVTAVKDTLELMNSANKNLNRNLKQL